MNDIKKIKSYDDLNNFLEEVLPPDQLLKEKEENTSKKETFFTENEGIIEIERSPHLKILDLSLINQEALIFHVQKNELNESLFFVDFIMHEHIESMYGNLIGDINLTEFLRGLSGIVKSGKAYYTPLSHYFNYYYNKEETVILLTSLFIPSIAISKTNNENYRRVAEYSFTPYYDFNINFLILNELNMLDMKNISFLHQDPFTNLRMNLINHLDFSYIYSFFLVFAGLHNLMNSFNLLEATSSQYSVSKVKLSKHFNLNDDIFEEKDNKTKDNNESNSTSFNTHKSKHKKIKNPFSEEQEKLLIEKAELFFTIVEDNNYNNKELLELESKTLYFFMKKFILMQLTFSDFIFNSQLKTHALLYDPEINFSTKTHQDNESERKHAEGKDYAFNKLNEKTDKQLFHDTESYGLDLFFGKMGKNNVVEKNEMDNIYKLRKKEQRNRAHKDKEFERELEYSEKQSNKKNNKTKTKEKELQTNNKKKEVNKKENNYIKINDKHYYYEENKYFTKICFNNDSQNSMKHLNLSNKKISLNFHYNIIKDFLDENYLLLLNHYIYGQLGEKNLTENNPDIYIFSGLKQSMEILISEINKQSEENNNNNNDSNNNKKQRPEKFNIESNNEKINLDNQDHVLLDGIIILKSLIFYLYLIPKKLNEFIYFVIQNSIFTSKNSRTKLKKHEFLNNLKNSNYSLFNPNHMKNLLFYFVFSEDKIINFYEEMHREIIFNEKKFNKEISPTDPSIIQIAGFVNNLEVYNQFCSSLSFRYLFESLNKAHYFSYISLLPNYKLVCLNNEIIAYSKNKNNFNLKKRSHIAEDYIKRMEKLEEINQKHQNNRADHMLGKNHKERKEHIHRSNQHYIRDTVINIKGLDTNKIKSEILKSRLMKDIKSSNPTLYNFYMQKYFSQDGVLKNGGESIKRMYFKHMNNQKLGENLNNKKIFTGDALEENNLLNSSPKHGKKNSQEELRGNNINLLNQAYEIVNQRDNSFEERKEVKNNFCFKSNRIYNLAVNKKEIYNIHKVKKENKRSDLKKLTKMISIKEREIKNTVNDPNKDTNKLLVDAFKQIQEEQKIEEIDEENEKTERPTENKEKTEYNEDSLKGLDIKKYQYTHTSKSHYSTKTENQSNNYKENKSGLKAKEISENKTNTAFNDTYNSKKTKEKQFDQDSKENINAKEMENKITKEKSYVRNSTIDEKSLLEELNTLENKDVMENKEKIEDIENKENKENKEKNIANNVAPPVYSHIKEGTIKAIDFNNFKKGINDYLNKEKFENNEEKYDLSSIIAEENENEMNLNKFKDKDKSFFDFEDDDGTYKTEKTVKSKEMQKESNSKRTKNEEKKETLLDNLKTPREKENNENQKIIQNNNTGEKKDINTKISKKSNIMIEKENYNNNINNTNPQLIANTELLDKLSNKRESIIPEKKNKEEAVKNEKVELKIEDAKQEITSPAKNKNLNKISLAYKYSVSVIPNQHAKYNNNKQNYDLDSPNHKKKNSDIYIKEKEKRTETEESPPNFKKNKTTQFKLLGSEFNNNDNNNKKKKKKKKKNP